MDVTSSNLEKNSENSRRFGRYVVKGVLGEGAMGRVFLAEDPVLQRLIAVKVIALERPIDEKTKREYLERFAIEARSSAKLSHPSIVAVHDAGQQDGVPWIAFEYVKGERLDQVLKKEKNLSFERLTTIAIQIASALQLAHEHHIVHRDIKPANILLDSRTGIAKLADFGVVKAPWAVLTQSGTSVGSPGYMSPEQIDGSQIDSRSDLFSLGIVIYEMITGRHPFVRDTVPATFYATISGDYEPLKKLRADTPPELVKVINSLLKSQKELRLSSAQDLIDLISPVQRTSTGIPVNLKSLRKRPVLLRIAALPFYLIRILLTSLYRKASVYTRKWDLKQARQWSKIFIKGNFDCPFTEHYSTPELLIIN